MGLLLPFFLTLLLYSYLRRLSTEPVDRRQTVLLVAMILGVFVAWGTELLSAIHLLTRIGVFLYWSLGCLAALGLHFSVQNPHPSTWKSIRVVLHEAGVLSFAMALTITVFVTVTGLVTLWAVPNNFDSMIYHLSRVIHWRQDHSIAFYGTSDDLQNSAPPLAEWTILHLTFLQGNADLANLVQWLCYVGCIVGASVVAEMLGGSSREGLIAAFFVATLPAATLEATSTQNDLVMAFWLTCLVYGCLLLTRKVTYRATSIVGAGLGLGLLTKTVVALYATPFVLWAAVILLGHGVRKAAPHLVLLGLLALTLNLGHFSRNYLTSQSLFGPDPQNKKGMHLMSNDLHTPGAVFSNILRNLSLHAVVNHQKSFPEHLVIRIHQLLGLDPSDPRTTFANNKYFIYDDGEDGSPMPFHLAVIILAFGLVLLRFRRNAGIAATVAICILSGAFLFCLILKWQPFHSRLHLPLFILSAPVAALLFQGGLFRYLLAPVVVLLAWMSLPDVFEYPCRPALGPNSVFIASSDDQQYRTYFPLRELYPRIIQLLLQDHVKEVGFISNHNQWEYPLAAYGNFHSRWRTDQVLIWGRYAHLETKRVPDALVCARRGLGEILVVHRRTYHRIYTGNDPSTQQFLVSVYLPVSAPAP